MGASPPRITRILDESPRKALKTLTADYPPWRAGCGCRRMQEQEELATGWRRFKQTTEKEIDRGWRGLNGSELRKLTADYADPKKRVGLNRGSHGCRRMMEK